jgi:hypothetical protein
LDELGPLGGNPKLSDLLLFAQACLTSRRPSDLVGQPRNRLIVGCETL